MACLVFDSPLGSMNITTRNGFVTALSWNVPSCNGRDTEPDALATEAMRQIFAYFEGSLRDFDLPLAPEGTPFRQRVWDTLRRIPYGQTVTYGALAQNLNTAPRAIGGACGANPLPILIPCHRVTGSAGVFGGYSGPGGLETKRWLLNHESRSRF